MAGTVGRMFCNQYSAEDQNMALTQFKNCQDPKFNRTPYRGKALKNHCCGLIDCKRPETIGIKDCPPDPYDYGRRGSPHFGDIRPDEKYIPSLNRDPQLQLIEYSPDMTHNRGVGVL